MARRISRSRLKSICAAMTVLRPLIQFGETLHTIRDETSISRSSNVYHYALFAHKLFECVGGCVEDIELTSGISANLLPLENGASDFVVSLGDAAWRNTVDPMETQQAGTFMHELGHNLGLNHAGATESEEPDEILNKPNHLSVMNYLYQTSGLVVSDQGFKFDYSRYNMAVLDENFLNESEGILPVQSGINVTYTLGVKHYCAPQDPATITRDASIVDWDCRCGVAGSAPISWNITGDLVSPLDSTEIFSRLPVHDEWNRLVFTGGRLYRQRSLLWPLIADRAQHDPDDTGDNNPAPPAHGLDTIASAPLVRQFIVPPPVTTAIAEQLLLEELAPRKTQALRRAAKNFPNLLNTIRDWPPIDLAAPFNDLFDGLIPTGPADRR
ncbi:MAG: hypothetical protein IPK16_09980 [Anaerolineales bacterium]|nr:hypothetical protein [Anaerolineales bacterium]